MFDPIPDEVRQRIRRDVETTTDALDLIARRHGVNRSTVTKWKGREGWVRPGRDARREDDPAYEPLTPSEAWTAYCLRVDAAWREVGRHQRRLRIAEACRPPDVAAADRERRILGELIAQAQKIEASKPVRGGPGTAKPAGDHDDELTAAEADRFAEALARRLGAPDTGGAGGPEGGSPGAPAAAS